MVSIITAGPDDWRAVRDVRLRALTDSPDAFGVTLQEARAQADAVWRERLEGSNPTLLALEEDHPVGMGGGFLPPDSDVAWIWGMWIAPEHRGTGLGRRILDALVRWAQGTGRVVHLHVAEGNHGARALYVSSGFVSTGQWEPLRDGSPVQIEKLVLRRG